LQLQIYQAMFIVNRKICFHSSSASSSSPFESFVDTGTGMRRRPLNSRVYIRKRRHWHWRWRCFIKNLCVTRIRTLANHMYRVHDPNIMHSDFSVKLPSFCSVRKNGLQHRFLGRAVGDGYACRKQMICASMAGWVLSRWEVEETQHTYLVLCLPTGSPVQP
jgi:hypothetical protein